MDIINSDYLRFNNLYIGPDGTYGGLGTYSSSWGFICGTAIINGTYSGFSTERGYSASYVFNPRVFAMSTNTTYTPGTNSICYISKSNTSNLNLNIATPSFDGTYIIFKRTDTNAGYVQLQPTSTQTNIVPRGISATAAVTFFRLNGSSLPTSIKLVYFRKTWYEV